MYSVYWYVYLYSNVLNFMKVVVIQEYKYISWW